MKNVGAKIGSLKVGVCMCVRHVCVYCVCICVSCICVSLCTVCDTKKHTCTFTQNIVCVFHPCILLPRNCHRTG